MTDAADRIDFSAEVPIYLGCAGWSLPPKAAAYFSSDGTHLERYAQVFSAVEINSSFHRPHQSKTYARWAASVPDAFRFSVKIPRTITHQLKLRDADAAMRTFLEQVTALDHKLGCLLLQLSPSLALDEPEALRFFSMLRGFTNVPVACEPRHVSWFSPEAAALMRAAGVACVHAHPLPKPGVEPAGDPHTLYIRLHGAPRLYYSSYDEAFIDTVATRIAAARRTARQVWCIFDNTAHGEAIPNALRLQQRLQVFSSEVSR